MALTVTYGIEYLSTEYCQSQEYGLYSDAKGFAKIVNLIHVDQLNTISNHNGVADPPPVNHPRAAHNQLGYNPSYTSYINRTFPSV